MVFDLRCERVHKAISVATMATWTATIWLSSLAVVGEAIGGDWSRVLVVSMLILAGIGTIVLAIAQMTMPMLDLIQIGINIGRAEDRQDQETPGAVPINGHRPSPPRQLRKGIPTPAGSS